MAKLKKILSIMAVCLCTFFGLAWLGMRLLLSDMCGNQIIVENLSPDRDLKAILFKRDCGATTSGSYQVSVLNPWDSLSNADCGNVFVSYAAPTLKWKDDRTLLITRKTSAQIFQEQKAITVWPLFKNIKIEYASP